MSQEHYEAQSEYAKLLFVYLEIPFWKHPIKSFKAFLKAEELRESHRKCCDWANEEDT